MFRKCHNETAIPSIKRAKMTLSSPQSCNNIQDPGRKKSIPRLQSFLLLLLLPIPCTFFTCHGTICSSSSKSVPSFPSFFLGVNNSLPPPTVRSLVRFCVCLMAPDRPTDRRPSYLAPIQYVGRGGRGVARPSERGPPPSSFCCCCQRRCMISGSDGGGGRRRRVRFFVCAVPKRQRIAPSSSFPSFLPPVWVVVYRSTTVCTEVGITYRLWCVNHAG